MSFLGNIIGNAVTSALSDKISKFTNSQSNREGVAQSNYGTSDRSDYGYNRDNRSATNYDPYYGPNSQQQQLDMYGNNNNNSGYPGYPPQQQGGYGGQQSGGGGYNGPQGCYVAPPQGEYGGPPQGGYPPNQPGFGSTGGPGAYAPNLGFGGGVPAGCAAPYFGAAGGGYPPQGHGDHAGQRPAPYPGSGPQMGFTGAGYGACAGYGSGGVYPTHAVDNITQNYGGGPGGPPPSQPYGAPQFQPHSPFHGPRASAIAMAASRPTLYASQNFNANAAAESLRKAMKGFGCDKNKIVQILCGVSSWQRQEIANVFKGMYGKDLIAELKSELSGDFEELVLALMEPPAQYDARQLHDAMAVGIGTKESVLIEIMTTRTNAQIQAIKQAYRQLYRCELEKDLIGDTSGHFQRLLISLCIGTRDESCRVDALKANQDARELYRAGEQRLGTDESVFNAILASQNFAQLRAVFDEYQKIANHPIERAIQSEFSGDVLNGLMAIVKCVRNRPAYFAELLYNSMKGLGTRDADLIRLVVSRAEIDLADVRDAYHRQYGTSLEKAIASECSGAYKDGLIALVKGN